MPQILTSQTPELPFASTARRWSSRRALGVTIALLALVLGTGWFATRELGLHGAQTKPVQTAAALDRAALERLDLSTFQKRGTLLVGETTTSKGVRLRVVLDARTHALVGLRVVESEP